MQILMSVWGELFYWTLKKKQSGFGKFWALVLQRINFIKDAFLMKFNQILEKFTSCPFFFSLDPKGC